jgi:hypothetical protein
MSVFSALHAPYTTAPSRNALRAFFVDAIRRIADSPLDNSVMQALPARQIHEVVGDRTHRPHAQWHATSGPDGARRLTATWHVNK